MNKLKMKSEKIKVQNAKQSEGITLVALIITIIVLLILAMVSIRLVINGGIIDRAERGKDKYSEEEIGEQLKLAYSEWQMGNYSDSVDVQAKLRALYGENTKAEIKNGVLKATINGNVYRYNVSTGKTEGYTDPINYGTKTRDTVVRGDNITLGTEQFRVFDVSNGEIKAVPFYNLFLNETPIKQATSENGDNAGDKLMVSWASNIYWNRTDDAIDMNNSKNLIQPYITNYKTTLESMGLEYFDVRMPRYSDLSASGVTNSMRNPGQKGAYWLGSAYGNGVLRGVRSNGQIAGEVGWSTSNYGIRPILIIK